MPDPTVPGTRCSQCGAALRPGAPWCTQCYVAVDAAASPGTGPAGRTPSGSVATGSLLSGSVPAQTVPARTVPPGSVPPGSVPTSSVPPGSVPAQAVPGSAPVGADVAPPSAAPPGDRVLAAGATWPCEGCGHGNLLSEDACAACGTAFLAAVRQEAPTLVLPVVGDLAVLPQARRVALAVGLVIAFLAVAALLGLLIA